MPWENLHRRIGPLDVFVKTNERYQKIDNVHKYWHNPLMEWVFQSCQFSHGGIKISALQCGRIYGVWPNVLLIASLSGEVTPYIRPRPYWWYFFERPPWENRQLLHSAQWGDGGFRKAWSHRDRPPNDAVAKSLRFGLQAIWCQARILQNRNDLATNAKKIWSCLEKICIAG